MKVNFYYDPIRGLVHFNFVKARPVFNYARDKGRTVTFNNGKDSMKLRVFIREKASFLSKISNGNYSEIRDIFIEAYETEGIPAVETIFKESVIRIYKSLT